ncbi:MAG: hypothetical protein KQJ78_17545 [Deltaproteobacteria bacterium]|nr:hypothetical protein [Deltaproteobacteria bacterium]
MPDTPAERYRSFRPAWQNFGVYILGVILFLVGPYYNPNAPIGPYFSWALAVLLAGFVVVTRYGRVYQVTEEEVVATVLLPHKSEARVRIKDLVRVDPRRGLSQRLLGVAHFWLYVEGQEEPALKLIGVPKPLDFQKLLVERGAKHTRVVGAFRR